ncbi:hemolysin-type calcium-binding repeat 2 copies family protein [Asticcacaulis biprosthecium C19]|uniref:Hemolysin-type calcium-binding repeat 2 copies family protein n=1 Tax=Asticcacaulis biprosthecium C19 TaxID=715226 RepID=F4QK99_9CAUL|nr:calcium-binding protein [Asticcacaulis biprosthecium]EGF93277.1 hemolysin-type calcium-binding repeat 2 copies family protein [Asticcacaulis biprosthecium C19]
MTQSYYSHTDRLGADEPNAFAGMSQVTQLSDGGYVVVWGESGSSARIQAQRFDAHGLKVGDEILVSTGGWWASGSTVLALQNGGFAISWYSGGVDISISDFTYNVVARIYSADGVPTGAEFVVNTWRPTDQMYPSMAQLTNGNLVFAWMSNDFGQPAIHVRPYDGYGFGEEVVVNTTVLATTEWNDVYTLRPTVTALADGGFLVSWTSTTHDGDSLGISARLFTAEGLAVGPEFQVNSVSEGAQLLPVAVAMADGGVLAAWLTADSYTPGVVAGTAIVLQRFDAEGVHVGEEIHIAAPEGELLSNVDIIELSNGGFAVGWGQGETTGVLVQVYNAAGQAVGSPLRVSGDYSGRVYGIDLAPLADGGFAVTWTAYNGQNVVVERHFSATGVAGQGMYVLGDEAAESVIGGSGDDTVYGAAGNDTVEGLGGSDQLFGESGDDVLNGGDETDGLIGGSGADRLAGGNGGDYLTDEVSSISANLDNDTLEGGSGDDILATFGGADVIDGGEGQDNFVFYRALATTGLLIDMTVAATATGITLADGTVARNVERGLGDTGSGNDTFVGGLSFDVVSLGDGNDQADGGDGADYLEGKNGHDTLVGGADHDWLFGAEGNDVLNGGTGYDSLAGGAGDDLLVIDSQYDALTELADEGNDTVAAWFSYQLTTNFENLVLMGGNNLYGAGNGLANRLTGNLGNNTLAGGGGNDTLAGGWGDDVYAVDAGDVVTEKASEGTDTVWTLVNFNLSANVENLQFNGTGNFTGNGNGLANVITGNIGNDWLEGAGGNDTLIGGLGNDVFVIDADDVIVEAAGEGAEWVLAARSYTLGANLEHLGLTGSGDFSATGNSANNIINGNSGKNLLTGGEGHDRLDGGVGVDRMLGGLGDDTYYVDNAGDSVGENHLEGSDIVFASVSYSLAGRAVETLTLTGTGNLNGTGNSLNNTIAGTSGHNVLDGGAGADKLVGGLGDDTYYVDNAGDNVVEQHWQGTDTVIASVSYSLLGRAAEVLTLTGSSNLNGTGNSLNNTLAGNAGNNVLDGGAGADKLVGGLGDDTYYVDNAGDNVVEQHWQGTDTVVSSVSYSLFGRAAEILTLTGSAHINATGNSLANMITGNSGNNQLDGGAGNDGLTGGLGADIFLFSAASGKDTVADFSAAQNDSIDIHAYTGGVANNGMVSQAGGNVLINLGGGNTVTMLNASQADVLSHMVW